MLLKRLFDIVFSVIAIIVLAPLFLIISLLIYLKLGLPIFFIQTRPGKDEKLFRMFKFRSMHTIHDSDGMLLDDSKRIDSFGVFLRSTSLDELPELWNVIKGDMSLVGPRPLLTEYIPLYNKKQARRHEIKPGISGWAQVNGRTDISFTERFNYDLWYVDNRSFILDIKIILLTFKLLIRKKNSTSKDNIPGNKFNGNN